MPFARASISAFGTIRTATPAASARCRVSPRIADLPRSRAKRTLCAGAPARNNSSTGRRPATTASSPRLLPTAQTPARSRRGVFHGHAQLEELRPDRVGALERLLYPRLLAKFQQVVDEAGDELSRRTVGGVELETQHRRELEERPRDRGKGVPILGRAGLHCLQPPVALSHEVVDRGERLGRIEIVVHGSDEAI